MTSTDLHQIPVMPILTVIGAIRDDFLQFHDEKLSERHGRKA